MVLDPLKTDSYDYDLPDHLIAKYPAIPADTAKLLVYKKNTKEIIHTTFNHLLDFIPNNTHIFFNDTKVIKARIFGKKQTGGKIELLFNKPLPNNQYLVYMRGKVLVDNIISFDDNLKVKIISLEEDGTRVVEFYKHSEQSEQLDFEQLVDILNSIGHLPLPPYLKREDEKDDETTYQTLFAKNYGAVAAPTASLHFTPKLLDDLKSKYNTSYLTLHVGAGTFKPVETDNILEHPMHSEFYNIINDDKTILDNIDNKILAVGTTVTRTVEFYNNTKQLSGEANLFLNPTNIPKRVDYLLTNFHLPKSTLIMLVASFIGLEETMKLYDIAIKEEYRFFSYGDAMIIV